MQSSFPPSFLSHKYSPTTLVPLLPLHPTLTPARQQIVLKRFWYCTVRWLGYQRLAVSKEIFFLEYFSWHFEELPFLHAIFEMVLFLRILFSILANLPVPSHITDTGIICSLSDFLQVISWRVPLPAALLCVFAWLHVLTTHWCWSLLLCVLFLRKAAAVFALRISHVDFNGSTVCIFMFRCQLSTRFLSNLIFFRSRKFCPLWSPSRQVYLWSNFLTAF